MVVIQVQLSMREKKMALCIMWVAEVERAPTILSAAIHSSLQVFRHEARSSRGSASDSLRTTRVHKRADWIRKWLVYQILPFCASFILERTGKVTAAVPVVLIVSPLIALMQDQAHKLKRLPTETQAHKLKRLFSPSFHILKHTDYFYHEIFLKSDC